MKSLKFVVCLLACAAVFADPPATIWDRVYDMPNSGGGIRTVLQTQDGGFIAGGTADFDIYMSTAYLMKVAGDGTPIWSKNYYDTTGQNTDSGITIFIKTIELTNGNLALAGLGFVPEFDRRTGIVALLDSDGNRIWLRAVFTEIFTIVSALQAETGDILVYGLAAHPTNPFLRQPVFACLSASGSLLWSRRYDIPAQEIYPEQSFIAAAHGGGYLLCIRYRGLEPDNRNTLTFLHVNAQGDSLTSNVLQFPYGENFSVYDMTPTTDGGYLLGGATDEDFPLLIKVDSDLDTAWTKIEEVFEYIAARYLTALPDGGAVVSISGQVSLGPNPWDSREAVTLLRIDAQGESVWTKVLTDSIHDFCAGPVARTSDGGYICGATIGYIDGDVYMARLTSDEQEAAEPALDYLSAQQISLKPNYPNPFNSTTRIEFTVPSLQRVSLRVFDLLGREVAVLADEMRAAGTHRVLFDGSELSSGVYFCRMEAGQEMRMQKIVLMK